MIAATFALALASAAAAEPAVAADPFADALREATGAWVRRSDPAALADAIAALARAAALRPGDAAAELKLARAHAFRAASDPKAAPGAWRECARAGERALRRAAPGWARAADRGEVAGKTAAHVGPEGAEPLYWVAACGMGLVRTRGVAAVLSAKDELRALMERAAELDETVDHAGPHRTLGSWLAALPSAAGGGAAQSRRHFDRARELAPEYRLARVMEAETLAVLLQDRAMFDRLLGEVLAADPARPAALAPENALARREAERLRARADRLF